MNISSNLTQRALPSESDNDSSCTCGLCTAGYFYSVKVRIVGLDIHKTKFHAGQIVHLYHGIGPWKAMISCLEGPDKVVGYVHYDDAKKLHKVYSKYQPFNSGVELFDELGTILGVGDGKDVEMQLDFFQLEENDDKFVEDFKKILKGLPGHVRPEYY